MSDTEVKDQNESTEDKSIDKDAVIQDLQKQLDAVKSKADELLAETKKAKQKAREESEQKERAKLEKAKKDGDYEQLLKSSEEQRNALQNKLSEWEQKVSSEKLNAESMKIAIDLADGANAEILSEFINKRLKYTEDGIKVLDKKGELTVSTIEDLKKEFQDSDKYKSLLRGNKSSGGSAQGGGSGTKSSKIIDRKTFDSMDQVQRMRFSKEGGSVQDNLN